MDHKATRPNVDMPTEFDVLENVRSLCVTHDGQVKERPNGQRMQGGEFKVRGCDVDGWPLSPRHRQSPT